MAERSDKPEQLRVWVGGDSGFVVVAIDPPSNDTSRERKFLVPLHAGSAEVEISADVLYTHGTTEGRGGNSDETEEDDDDWDEPVRDYDEPEAWHAKVYRCRTPQEATQLRSHFNRQAIDINRANGELSGPRLSPPWAMAPVYVVRADGEDQRQGALSTHLGAAPEAVVLSDNARVWEWFGRPDEPQRENYFVVLSRLLSNPMDIAPKRPRPGAEELRYLLPMAQGLDICHQSKIAHCDIKPDNVRMYFTGTLRNYVLVDSDAVTRLHSKPLSIRCTEPFILPDLYHRFQTPVARREDRVPISDEELRAHDRYAFALVTLAAVAGDGIVDALASMYLYGAESTEPDPEEIVGELMRVWADNRWLPLARVLAKGFSARALHDPEWRIAAWINEARDAAGVSGSTRRGTATADVDPIEAALVSRYRPEINIVRRLLPSPMRRSDSTRLVMAKTDQMALSLARKSAMRSFAGSFGAMAVVSVAVLFLVIRGL